MVFFFSRQIFAFLFISVYSFELKTYTFLLMVLFPLQDIESSILICIENKMVIEKEKKTHSELMIILVKKSKQNKSQIKVQRIYSEDLFIFLQQNKYKQSLPTSIRQLNLLCRPRKMEAIFFDHELA